MTDRRFIEESFPVKQIGEVGAKEKRDRHAQLSTLHTWWARRPLVVSRTTAYAALTKAPADVDEWQDHRDTILELGSSKKLNPRVIQKARTEIACAGQICPPAVLDPFGGGGSFPFEAVRLGCETYAGDYNPVAVLIMKASIEYPQRFGQVDAVGPEKTLDTNTLFADVPSKASVSNRLLEEVKRWGAWVGQEALKDLRDFYVPARDGSTPVAYIWAHTITCQNPQCAIDFPLIRQYWLSKDGNQGVAMFPSTADGSLQFSVVGKGYADWPDGFDAEQGTVSGAVAKCPLCHAMVDDQTTRRLFQEGRTQQRMIAVISHLPRRRGKIYRVATSTDEASFRSAVTALQQLCERLLLKWGIEPNPDEPLPPTGTLGFRIQRYGMNTWGDLFNARQKLSLITFADKVRQAYEQMLAQDIDQDLAIAVTTYLALGIDRLADYGSMLSVLNPTGGRGVKNTFARQTVQMVWDYAESNPFNPEGAGWTTACEKNEKWIEFASSAIQAGTPTITITQASATRLPYPDEKFDAVLTDPPYYDNVPYSYLSDLFYVWLKRSVGYLYPELFSTPLTPKSDEVVAYSHQLGGAEAGKRFFEEKLAIAFREMRRVLKKDGIAVIVYTHKSTEGWETVINALLDSGLVTTSAWPINTEMTGRLRAQESAALASSIYIVARKLARQPIGFYNEVRDEVRHHLGAKLQRLWEEGVGGADFFIAAIGSAIEVFGKYEQVLDYDGAMVRADRLLEDVRTIATDYAVHQILHDGFAGEISDLTRFYVLWRWEYGEARVPFDEARKLAQSCGLDVSREWGRGGFVKKDKEFIQVLGPQSRKLDALTTSHEMIDVLHNVLLLWEQGRRTEMVSALADSGYGASEAFYRVAQAISETLPNESKEKKLLDGFLAGRGRVRDEVEQIVHRPTLWQE
jgi:adenine-specific DNA methylase